MIDDIDRAQDKWISIRERRQLGIDAAQQLIKITPDIVKDLNDCPIADSLVEIQQWEKEYWRPDKFVKLVAKNSLKHALKVF